MLRAVEKPESERTPGEKLIAQQVIDQVTVGRQADRASHDAAEDAAKKKALNDQIAALNTEKPKPLPMASIVTDGDCRFAPDGDGNEGRLSEMPDPGRGSREIPEFGPGRDYKVPPSYFLMRGDPDTKGSTRSPVSSRGDLRESAHRASTR